MLRLSSFQQPIINNIFDFSNHLAIGFTIQVIAVTFLLLLFGEVIPKIYSNRNSKKITQLMAYPLIILRKAFFALEFDTCAINPTLLVNACIENQITFL